MHPANSHHKNISNDSDRRSLFGPKDYITIVLAVLILIAGIVISIFKGFEIELIVFILIAFAIGLLSFLMIGKIATKGISFAGIKISQASGGFLIFILILASFLGYKKITNQTGINDLKITNQAEINALKDSLTNSIHIANPEDSSVWYDASGVFEWFNPPLAYAAKEHLKTKMNWFRNKDFQLKILLIQSEDPAENKDIFIKRIKNLKEFVSALTNKYKEELKIEDHIEVRICIDKYIPTQSFFTTNNWANKHSPNSIFYLPFNDNPIRPSKCIVSASKEFHAALHDEFNRHWEKNAMPISLTKLLRTPITDTLTRESLIAD